MTQRCMQPQSSLHVLDLTILSSSQHCCARCAQTFCSPSVDGQSGVLRDAKSLCVLHAHVALRSCVTSDCALLQVQGVLCSSSSRARQHAAETLGLIAQGLEPPAAELVSSDALSDEATGQAERVSDANECLDSFATEDVLQRGKPLLGSDGAGIMVRAQQPPSCVLK